MPKIKRDFTELNTCAIFDGFFIKRPIAEGKSIVNDFEPGCLP
ncbi:hypothetical protein [Candidatus Methanoperedens nitratireducens]|uniref:Uncharacterized protein n=1 Tax=Candidatus Methanoperedens nitratireducens TaxID=1392998 RepID=A0A284VRX8_9EURY|nr:hypothetical protein [Candidatus Methanoperedens nitroreducens]SNQ62036.1 hypothetical protein MNV_560082 [Candidatus Methanoperedens nitroreducens]